MVPDPVISVASRDELPKFFKSGGVGAELGVLYADYSLILHSMAKPRKLYLVDRWTLSSPGDWKPGNDSWQEILQTAKSRMSGCAGVQFVESGSLEWLKAQEDNSLDWVYLDADHSRLAVAAEIAEARRVVRPAGIIAGHDYTLDPRDEAGDPYPCGVVEAVQDAVAQGVGDLLYLTRERVASFAIRTGLKPSKKLVVGCSPRTGSNLLVDSLSQHPRAINAGEIFNPVFCTPRVMGLRHRGLDPLEHCNLFKLFSYDDGSYGFAELLDESHVVYLYREDRSAQLASWKRAAETGIWYECQAVPYMVPFPADAEEAIDSAQRLFADRAGVVLSYEKLVQDWEGSVSAVLALAGWEDMRLTMARERQT